MRFNTIRFRIDPTPRRADGEYIAHARIITFLVGERESYAPATISPVSMRVTTRLHMRPDGPKCG